MNVFQKEPNECYLALLAKVMHIYAKHYGRMHDRNNYMKKIFSANDTPSPF